MESSIRVVEALKAQKTGREINLSSGWAEEPNLGVRKSMEDYLIHQPDILEDGNYSFYCVLDGHGGNDVSKYLSENFAPLLQNNFRIYDGIYGIDDIFILTLEVIENNMRLINAREVGSTFCAVLIDKKLKEMYVVNIGDSQVLQVACEDDRKLSSGFLSRPHKTTNVDEIKRISTSGGTVSNGRVGGFLMITRSLGDFSLKKYGVISTPDIDRYVIDTTSLLIIGSDGIWDFVKPEDVMNLLVSNQDFDCDNLARCLAQESIIKGSLDNISLICVLIY